MKTLIVVFVSLFFVVSLTGSLLGGNCIFNSDRELLCVAEPAVPVPPPLWPNRATLIDSFEATPEYDWSLNADFAWANVFDTNDITEPFTVTEVQFRANPTLGVEYEFYMTTDAGGVPNDADITFLASRNDLDGGGVFDWVSVDVSAAGYEVQPGQVYWFIRTCPIGGWPGFTWSSATNYTPPVNPPVKITQTFPSGGWGSWVADWWMLFKIYGDPSASGFTLSISPDPLIGGQPGTFTVTNGAPNTNTYLAYSLAGPGSTYVPFLQVTLDLASPKKGAGPTMTDPSGGLTWKLNVPKLGQPRKIALQAAQKGQVSNVVFTSIQ